jgi:hypothetical protein
MTAARADKRGCATVWWRETNVPMEALAAVPCWLARNLQQQPMSRAGFVLPITFCETLAAVGSRFA